MLRITIEYVPFGQESQKRPISQFVIHNIGPAPQGEHRYKLSRELGSTPACEFTHTRADGLVTCVRKALQAAESQGLDKTPMFVLQ